MSEVVAKRYADALFQLASEKEVADKLISELEIVKEVFQNEAQLNAFLTDPRITNEQKHTLIDSSFGKLDKYIVNTLKLLAERGRASNVATIVDEYVRLYNESRGTEIATVYSTRALTDDEKAQIATSFKTRFNKKEIIIKNEIDPSLLGGMKIRVGNTIYDGSVQNKLNRMKQNIVSETI